VRRSPLTALVSAAATPHPYPLIRSGGVFLICVGAGLLFGWIFPRWWTRIAVVSGVSAVTATAMSAVPLALGTPSTLHIVALIGAVAVEVGLIAYVLRRLRDADEHTRMLSILAVVGLHLVIMGLAFGPLIAALGVLAMVNAAVGLRVPAVPLPVAGVLDSLLKIVFGVWMLAFYPAVTYGW
jgi:hypothetical protein